MNIAFNITTTFAILSIFLSSCKKDDTDTPVCELNVSVEHLMDGKPVEFNEIKYTNAAGERHSVTKIEYLLSNFELKTENGWDVKAGDVFYINPQKPEFTSIKFSDIPKGNYYGIRFVFGLDSIKNVDNSLPNTTEFRNMFWPSAMGGGYHRMKYEGKYLDKNNNHPGFAMHMGRNFTKFDVSIEKEFSVCNGSGITLKANMDQWLKNPEVYSFVNDGTSIMGNRVSMTKLAKNGHNVFSLK